MSHSSQNVPQLTQCPTAHKMSHSSQNVPQLHSLIKNAEEATSVTVEGTNMAACMGKKHYWYNWVVFWRRDFGPHANRLHKHCLQIIYSVSYEQKQGRKRSRTASRVRESMATSQVVLETFTYPPLNHVTYFGDRESVIAFGGLESVRLSVVTFCVKSLFSGLTEFGV
jgi:hypothetical protein